MAALPVVIGGFSFSSFLEAVSPFRYWKSGSAFLAKSLINL